MKKLRICMVSCEYPPNSAGIGERVYSLSKALVKLGHEVTVLTRGEFFSESTTKSEGIRVIRLPFIPFPPPFHLVYHGYFVNKKLREIENDFDLIHVNTPLVPKIHSWLPKVVQIHSLWREETKHFKDAKDIYSLAVRIFKNQVINSEKATLSQAKTIITYSSDEDKILQLYNLNLPKRIAINGAVTSNSKTQKKVAKNFDVIFAGRLNARKGVRELLQAAVLVIKKIPEAKFLITGDGGLKTWMEQQVIQKNIQSNFTFLGFVSNQKVKSYLAQSKISIVPSRYEPFGIVAGESMAAGLPVIGTRVGGIKSMVIDGVTGYLVNVGDFKSIAEKVIYLLKHSDKAAVMGAKGRERIRKFFNEAVVATKFEAVYKEII